MNLVNLAMNTRGLLRLVYCFINLVFIHILHNLGLLFLFLFLGIVKSK